ncbi:MAG: hypothetical protein PUE59_04620 [Treponema sp.]|nr:hypothetical protein [Treponema sp.]
MAEEKKYSGYGYHGGGRKAKDSEPRTCTMSIVCTRSEKEKIKQAASVYKLSVSEYVTRKLLDKL